MFVIDGTENMHPVHGASIKRIFVEDLPEPIVSVRVRNKPALPAARLAPEPLIEVHVHFDITFFGLFHHIPANVG